MLTLRLAHRHALFLVQFQTDSSNGREACSSTRNLRSALKRRYTQLDMITEVELS